MDLIRTGNGPKQLWFIARQHPGETMAEWWMEGLCERLFDTADSVAHLLKQQATIHIVPNMNPDGSFLGNLRTNAVGANLNREWQTPTQERSPEVLYVRNEMERTGVDFALDVHGDETLPYNFFAGPEGIPSYSIKQQNIFERYTQLLLDRSPDFQAEYGYAKDLPGKANLTVCSNYISEYFNCVAITIEQPFKDCATTPMPGVGWSPQRAKNLGAACLSACLPLLEEL
jgi:murein tripeptide amidase MpaA